MRYALSFSFFIGFIFAAACQSNPSPKASAEESGVSLTGHSAQTYKNIELAGKVWGFLKYYHPNVRAGRYNWDLELFHIIPKMFNRSNRERDSILCYWIAGLGYIGKEKRRIRPGSEIRSYPDLKWIDSSGFQNNLVFLLDRIASLRQTNSSYYVELRSIPKPDFSREAPYSELTFPDTGYRLLALFRYWNCINYYYPYKYDLLKNWDSVLPKEMVKFISAANELEYKLAILELISLLHDSHASLEEGGGIVEEFRGINYAPVELKFIDGQAVVLNYYDPALGKSSGLLAGDVILSINNDPIAACIRGKLALTPASSRTAQLRDIARDLLRTNDTVIKVLLKRGNGQISLIVKCYPASQMDINSKYNRQDTCLKILTNNIGYVNPWYLTTEDIPKIMNTLLRTRAFIIDFRYPVRDNILPLANYLLSKETIFAKLTAPSNRYPGSFTYVLTAKVGEQAQGKYRGKVILLVDENTQSSSEFNTMAFRTYDSSCIIGTATAGTDGDIVEMYLPGGVLTSFTGLGVYYPNNRPTQMVGIRPDIIATPTIDGIKARRDEILERAIGEAEKR